jgi:phosphoglycolate phosphatase
VTRPTIVFDLDGTLVDTAHDLVATLNAILVTEGMVPTAKDTAVAMVGSGARVMIEAAFAAAGRALTPETLDRLLRDYMVLYDHHLADESRPYPGVEESLDRFADEGWLLAVCTNKFEAPARKLLGLLGLAPRFAAITGQDTFAFRKPDPRHLTETVRLAGGASDNSVMVGDSITDIDTAFAADIPVVAVSFGYSPIPVADLKPTLVIASFAELWDAVAAIRGGPSP